MLRKILSGDITDHYVIRRVEQHPQAWRIWQPFIVQGQTEGDLIVAYGAMRHGKKDMGDIFVTLSQNDGESWSEPVAVFDHTVRQGNIQFAYANPHFFGAMVSRWFGVMRCAVPSHSVTVRSPTWLGHSVPTGGAPGLLWKWPCSIRGH